MAGNEPVTPGPADTVRRVARSLLGLAQTRTELFAVELQEEKLRAVNVLVALGACLAFGLAGVLVAVGGAALWLWQRAGYAGLAGLAVAALAVAAVIWWAVRRRLRRGPGPFAATVAEFRKDAEMFGP